MAFGRDAKQEDAKQELESEAVGLPPPLKRLPSNPVSLLAYAPFKAPPVDLLRSLEVNKEYKLTEFTGSADLPRVAIPIFGTNKPVWKHESCTFKVLPVQEKEHAKRLRITAKTVARTIDVGGEQKANPYHPGFGLEGTYQLEAVLERREGEIICTEVKGISGKVVIPSAVSASLKLCSATKEVGRLTVGLFSLGYWGQKSEESLNWDDLRAYNTGNIPQELQVAFELFSENTYKLRIVIDPNELKLTGASHGMLCALNKMCVVGPSMIEGYVTFPSKKHEMGQDRQPEDHHSEPAFYRPRGGRY